MVPSTGDLSLRGMATELQPARSVGSVFLCFHRKTARSQVRICEDAECSRTADELSSASPNFEGCDVKLKMAKNSIFAILLRSPWWISIGIVLLLSLLGFVVLPRQYAPYGAFASMPFLVVGVIAAWRQFGVPKSGDVAATVAAVRAMSWSDFSAALDLAFQQDGFAVAPLAGPAAHFSISKGGRIALVGCKRWKAVSTGIEPLRELQQAMQGEGAQECIYVTTGELTDTARSFAAAHRIRLIQDVTLAQLMRRQIKAATPKAR